MFVVTGASGQLGRNVVQGLLSRLSPDRIIASVRDAANATALVQQRVQVRVADFANPGGLAQAFAGAEQVLIVSVDRLGAEALELHRNAIDAARAAGARRVLYTSHMGAREDSPFAPASDHTATEGYLAKGGAPFTSLRHGFYAESALHLIGKGLEAFPTPCGPRFHQILNHRPVQLRPVHPPGSTGVHSWISTRSHTLEEMLECCRIRVEHR